jgi:hypothetical protein
MAAQPAERSPYVGPRPFSEDDRAAFFGRAQEIERLVSLVIANQVTLLYAVSGAGKSSLLSAGLLPALAEQGFDVLPVLRLQAPEAPPEDVNAYVYAAVLELGDDATTLRDALAGRERGEDAYGFPRPRVLVFDQFEELFTLHEERWTEREDFFADLAAALAAEPELRVVLALREEYLAPIERYAHQMPGAFRGRFHLERLQHDAALLAVTRPLEREDREFADGIAETLIRDLQQTRVDLGDGRTATVEGEFVEPVHLQVVCRTLWEGLAPSVKEITADHLAAFGNVDETLIRYYDEAVAAAAARARTGEYRLRRGIERSFVTSAGTRATVFAGRESGQLPAPALDELEARHLVRGEWRAGGRWLELAHDRLIEPLQSSNQVRRRRRARRRRGAGGALAILLAAAAVATSATGVWTGPEKSKPPPPSAQQLIDAYPGDRATPGALASWMGRGAKASGLPAELPVMAALVESGLRNKKLPGDTWGFFGLRRDIWNRGAYRGFPHHPPLQLRWFITQALAVRDQGLQACFDYAATPGRYGRWAADIERPMESERPKYQRNLNVARALLGDLATRPRATKSERKQFGTKGATCRTSAVG